MPLSVSGREIVVRFVQSLKALTLILFTPLPTTTFTICSLGHVGFASI